VSCGRAVDRSSRSLGGGTLREHCRRRNVGLCCRHHRWCTHLRTFNGLFYDFQASGDFTLAEVGRDFSVPNATSFRRADLAERHRDKAVAGRFGKTQVAICLAPSERDERAAIYVNGTLTPVGMGKRLDCRATVGIARQGKSINSPAKREFCSRHGQPYVDRCGRWVGQWPSPVRGLIANPNGNLNQIEARDGFVLTNPFNFNDLYHRFADSWRVSAKLPCCLSAAAESLLK